MWLTFQVPVDVNPHILSQPDRRPSIGARPKLLEQLTSRSGCSRVRS